MASIPHRQPPLSATPEAGHWSDALLARRVAGSPEAEAAVRLVPAHPTMPEQLLYRNSQLFEQFMHTSPLMAWVVDADGLLHYLNPVGLRATGIGTEAFGCPVQELFAPNLAAIYLNNNRQVVQGITIEQTEEFITTGGQWQVMNVVKFPMQVAGQTVVGGWATNMTQQTDLQNHLLKSNERHQYVNEATAHVIYDWDFTTGNMYRSSRLETLFGGIAPGLSVRDRLRQMHPDDTCHFKRIVFAALRNQRTIKWEVEYRIGTTERTYKTVLDKAFIIRSPNAATRVIGALQDITAQKELQRQLVMQEQTTRQELVKSIIETEEKERKKLSVELHDNVNQMLASCKLMLEVALEGGTHARLLTEKSYQSIQTVINEIRTISHELNPAALVEAGLVAAVEEAIDRINLAGKMVIRLDARKTAGAALLQEADNIAVFRIIQEHLNNILKHAQATDVTIWLHIQNQTVKLLIKDNGTGFNPNEVKKGLGMRNMANRVAYYNGTLSIESSKGKGCTLYIRLNMGPRPVA